VYEDQHYFDRLPAGISGSVPFNSLWPVVAGGGGMSDFWKDYEPEPTVTKDYIFTDAIPKYVGSYWIGGSMGLHISFKKKPIWLHRTMMRLCLGWEWKDAK